MGHRLAPQVIAGDGTATGGTTAPTPYPGRGADYPQASVNTTLSALIDRKAEKTEVGDPEVDLVLLFENSLA